MGTPPRPGEKMPGADEIYSTHVNGWPISKVRCRIRKTPARAGKRPGNQRKIRQRGPVAPDPRLRNTKGPPEGQRDLI